MEKVFKALPSAYRSECNQQGIIKSLYYNLTDSTGTVKQKHLNVYLPYGYDPDNHNKRYNVLYLMHGGGEDENLLFGGPGENRELKNILDHMIEKGEIAPLIVVTPTFNGVKNGQKNDPIKSHVKQIDHPLPIVETEFFYEEFVEDIIPFVETTFHTYVNNGDLADLKATRNHRAFGGFSMGSVTTWNVFVHCLDYVKYFMPLSGESWKYGMKSEGKMAKETAEYLLGEAKSAGYTYEDYYLFCATGKKDIAYPNMKPQMDALMELEPRNFYFMECEEGDHCWPWVNQYIYGIIPDLFAD